MIVNMPSKEGVTLATQGKYCAENIEVVPTFEISEGNTLNKFLKGDKTEITADDMLHVGNIRKYQFYYSPITSIEIPTTTPPLCLSIGEYAFANSQLTSIDIPDHVLNIYQGAFSDCSKLTSVKLPNSITSIPNNAFENCKALTGISIPEKVTSIGDYAFYYCSSLTSVTIPDSVTSIGYETFYYCSSLTSVTIPDSVTSIGVSAFRECDGITSIVIPDSVTALGRSVFWGCDNLISTVIGRNVTSIGKTTWYACLKLQEIICLSKTPPTISDQPFNGGTLAPLIKVPATSVEVYKSATNWSMWADNIIALTLEEEETYGN